MATEITVETLVRDAKKQLGAGTGCAKSMYFIPTKGVDKALIMIIASTSGEITCKLLPGDFWAAKEKQFNAAQSATTVFAINDIARFKKKQVLDDGTYIDGAVELDITAAGTLTGNATIQVIELP